ncbi:MAG: thioesterase family protein [Rickettsiales bacterium]
MKIVAETYKGAVYPWEIDIMGHMNVRFYMSKYDDATWQLFGMLGLTVAYFKEQERGMAAVQQNLTYGREVLAGDLVEIRSEIAETGARKIRFIHRMYETISGEEVASSDITGVHIDRVRRRSTPFPEHILAKAQEMMG